MAVRADDLRSPTVEVVDDRDRPVSFVEVRQAARLLRDLAARLDPHAVPLPEVIGMYTDLDAVERCAHAAKTLLAPRVAETKAWERRGHRSPAEHLAATTGVSRSQAQETLATGQHVAQLPQVEAALRAGALSRPQATAVADAAAADPSAQGRLIEAARTLSLGDLRDACRKVKAAADPDPDATHARLR